MFNVYSGYFKGVKCLGSDSDQETPSTTKVNNEWNYNSASHIYQHSMDRDTCSSRHIVVVVVVVVIVVHIP